MKTVKRRVSIVLAVLVFTVLCCVEVSAAGAIDTGADVALTIRYADGATPIPNAKFDLYKVADVNEQFRLTLTGAFEPYKNTVTGMDELETVDQAGWLSMASTLKGYVLRDGVSASAAGRTDGEGKLQLTPEPGLYLVLGTRITLEESFYTYTATPYMVFLPGLDAESDEWVYTVASEPKFEKDLDPEDDPDDVTRKVIKKWDDSGYESIRPESVTVQLLRDGSVYETKVLSAENNWRYSWDELDPEYEWLIVEEEMEAYAVTIEKKGVTFTVTNKFITPITGNDPPVRKRVTGDEPETPGVFTFVLEAVDPTNPMPRGSEESRKVMRIRGAGSGEFGDIVFDKTGIYEYTIREENTHATGYRYDKNEFRVVYEVKREGDKLVCTRTITDNSGAVVKNVEFTNHYKVPEPLLPGTGMLWWPIPVLALLGLCFIANGIRRRRSCEE